MIVVPRRVHRRVLNNGVPKIGTLCQPPAIKTLPLGSRVDGSRNAATLLAGSRAIRYGRSNLAPDWLRIVPEPGYLLLLLGFGFATVRAPKPGVK